MPQPGYNAAGQAQGHVNAWGQYISNRPANLSSLFGGILNRGSNVPAAAAGPRNPASIAPPGYTQAEWDAMSTTAPVVVRGQPVGGNGRTGGPVSFGRVDSRLSGPDYDAAGRAQNAQVADFQASGGYDTTPHTGTTQDAGHTDFSAQSHTHGLASDGVVEIQPGGIYDTVFAHGMGAGNPNAYHSGRYAPPIATPAQMNQPFVGPMPASAPRTRNFTNYASRTLGY